MKRILLKNEEFKRDGKTYTLVGFNERTRKVIIDKETQYGINYMDYRIDRIERKLTKKCTIQIDSVTLDLSETSGLEKYKKEIK